MPAACVNTAQINDSLSNIFVPTQLLAVLRAVAASVSVRGSLSTSRALTPYFCLLPRWPSLQREILPTGASRAWKCHPEIQGRDNLLCVLVVCGGLNAGMVYETYTLLTYFLTFICLLLTLRKIYPNHRKLQSHHLNFTPVELDAI